MERMLPNRAEHGAGKRPGWVLFPVLCALLLVLVFLSFLIGRFALSPHEIFRAVGTILTTGLDTKHDTVQAILVNIRLPRIIAAVLVGSALAGAGSAYQGIFRNPMVSPDILGASAGAGFGASLGILLDFSSMGIQLMAFFSVCWRCCSA
jgi:iron complex transport system permease protein